MIKKICIALTSLTFFLTTGFAMAETYKYVDENGNIHFTDDLSMVPENQRLNLNYYQDSQPADPVRKNEKQTDLSAEGDEIRGGSDKEQGRYSDHLLNTEYKEIIKKKEQLLKEKEAVKTPAQQKEYNKNAAALNKKINTYNIKSKEEIKKRLEDANVPVEGKKEVPESESELTEEDEDAAEEEEENELTEEDEDAAEEEEEENESAGNEKIE